MDIILRERNTSKINISNPEVQLVLKKATYAHVSRSGPFIVSSRGEQGFGSTGFGTPTAGAFIPQPMQQAYAGDMNAYKQRTAGYAPGVRRPVAAPPRNNHMF